MFGSLLSFRLVPPASNSSIDRLKLRPSLSQPVPPPVISEVPEQQRKLTQPDNTSSNASSTTMEQKTEN